MSFLNINTKAPNFSLLDDSGKKRTLKEFLGKFVVIYFYPKDNTPGCTRQACSIRDSYPDFEKYNTVIIGISSDSVLSHKKFKEKYSLPFLLLSDPEKQIIKKYKAIKQDNISTMRISYLIDPQGKIIHVFPKVSPDIHGQDLIEVLKSLQVK